MKPTLLAPWIALESMKSIYSASFGLASALMASNWARQFADFTILMSYYVDFYQASSTADHLRAQFTIQGIFLIIDSVLSVYFIVVVVQYYMEMKKSAEENQRSRPRLRLQEVPSIAEELNKPHRAKKSVKDNKEFHDIQHV